MSMADNLSNERLRDTMPGKRSAQTDSRYNDSDRAACIITVSGPKVNRTSVLYKIIVTEQAQGTWEIRQASALKEVLLWLYRRRHTVGADRERPAA